MNERNSNTPVAQAAVSAQPKKSWLTRLGIATGSIVLVLGSGVVTMQLLDVFMPKQQPAAVVPKKEPIVSNDKSADKTAPDTTALLAASLPPIDMTTSVVISDKTTVTASLLKGWSTTEQAIQSTSAENKTLGAVVTYGVLDMKSQYDASADNAEASLNAMNLINAVLNGRANDGNVVEIRKDYTSITTGDQKGLQMFYKWFEYSDKQKTLQRTEVAIRASAQKYIVVFYTEPKQNKSQFNELLNSMKVEGIS